jgi:hypothetical protein
MRREEVARRLRDRGAGLVLVGSEDLDARSAAELGGDRLWLLHEDVRATRTAGRRGREQRHSRRVLFGHREPPV